MNRYMITQIWKSVICGIFNRWVGYGCSNFFSILLFLKFFIRNNWKKTGSDQNHLRFLSLKIIQIIPWLAMISKCQFFMRLEG